MSFSQLEKYLEGLSVHFAGKGYTLEISEFQLHDKIVCLNLE